MALKAVLATLEGIPETDRSHYKQDGQAFVLDVEGLEDGSAHPAVKALVAAKRRESEALQAALGDAHAAKELARKVAADKQAIEEQLTARLKGTMPQTDFEALETSFKKKRTELENDFNGRVAERDTVIRTLLVDNVASTLATEIAVPGSAKVMLPHIRARLAAEITSDGRGITRVLGDDGKPSALSIDDLKKEFLDKPEFSPLILGGKATGGGAQGGNGSGGAQPAAKARLDGKDDPRSLAARVRAKIEG